jgi:hypothetical protein
MAFGDNSDLDTTATVTVVDLNNTNDEIDISGNALADAVYFGNGLAGDDRIIGFGKNDSIINYTKIFDGNFDGIIDFGPNGVLDIDRVSAKNAGADQITVQGLLGGKLRYLGTKNSADDYGTAHVYADASVRLAGFTEGKVSDDLFDASTGNRTYFYDTALGLNLGEDTITGFGLGDRIATTTRIHNGPDEGATITFGQNHVLDLPGEQDASAGDMGESAGGQIDFVSPDIDSLEYLGSSNVNGVTYYYYGLEIPA